MQAAENIVCDVWIWQGWVVAHPQGDFACEIVGSVAGLTSVVARFSSAVTIWVVAESQSFYAAHRQGDLAWTTQADSSWQMAWGGQIGLAQSSFTEHTGMHEQAAVGLVWCTWVRLVWLENIAVLNSVSFNIITLIIQYLYKYTAPLEIMHWNILSIRIN